MKQLSVFSGMTAQVLVGGAFLAIFFACPSSQAQAGSPYTDLQTADPVSGIQLAAENAPQQEMTPPVVPCPEGPDTCNSTNALPLPLNCTTGSKCSIEGKICNASPVKKCKTVNAQNVCYCGCM